MSNTLPSIYLAGPEVFLPQAVAIGEAKKAICRQHGYQGVLPLNTELGPSGCSPAEVGFQISALNEELIRSCDALIANMTPFRGISADVGTVYEMGFAVGLGKRVFAYTNVRADFASRTLAHLGPPLVRDREGRLCDRSGMFIEEWGLMDNLMLEGGLHSHGGELIIGTAPEDELYTDLEAFQRCVARATAAMRVQGPGPQ
jgi:nucleoside 2-deoxyribosyltransferase